MVRGFMDAAPAVSLPGRVVAALAPHAGYRYSGRVAGHTFRALRDDAAVHGAPETVVVLGFCHGAAFPGVAVLDAEAIATPAGETPLDTGAAAELVACSERLRLDNGPHDGEHSAENQVPFLQVALPETRLVMALMGDHAPPTLEAVVSALDALAARRRIAVVASTDLLHDADEQRVRRTDADTLAIIERLADGELLEAWSYRHQVCCGIGPVVAAMRYAGRRGATAGRVLCYRNSADEDPDSRGQWVVGYGAVVMTVPEEGAGAAKG
jgi:AmmeMemoRadiSam system protein B